MVTFGDMMSLLLTFFVLLLSFAQLDPVKYNKAKGSLKEAFGVQRLEEINPVMSERELIATEFNQEILLVKVREEVEFIVENLVDNGEAEVIETSEGFILRLDSRALFVPNSMTLKEDFETTLQQIGTVLADKPNLVRVVGHTDNRPPTPPYPSNWTLSGVKAAAVAHFLVQKGGVKPDRLQVRGLAEFQPVAQNDTQQGRANNDRIEILIARATASADAEPSQGPESAGKPAVAIAGR
ncbi:MAG: flagellar motor protein MotB [Magnetococcales bacterium]|nr:flagellar motor protein MotB [Magnetococcales bacterium]